MNYTGVRTVDTFSRHTYVALIDRKLVFCMHLSPHIIFSEPELNLFQFQLYPRSKYYLLVGGFSHILS